jgi:hypothetical protein
MATQNEGQDTFSSHYIAKKPTSATIQTTDHRLHGDIHVGLGKRLKDELDGGLQFLPVTNVLIFNESGDVLYRTHFLLINREHLVWILPDEDVIQEDEFIGN